MNNSLAYQKFHVGADHYPVHWPEEQLPIDARWMAEAGFNTVRSAEFDWSKLETCEVHI